MKSFKWKKYIKWIVIVLLIVIIAKVGFNRFSNIRDKKSIATISESSVVETRDIQVVLSSSGTVKPLNTYEVSTLVQGEAITADFEAGDQVAEGDVLYQITTDDLDSKIETSETAVTRAEKDYSKALESYEKTVENKNEAVEDYKEASAESEDLTIKSTESGIVKTLYAKIGDTIQVGGQIAEIYDNSSMLLKIPFNASEVDSTLIGETAEVEMVDSLETLTGEVTKVSNIEEVLSGNRVVKMVTIRVKNPGGLTITNTATASIGDYYSSSEGTFNVLVETVITADKSGEIVSLKIEEGSKITSGNTIITLSSDAVEDQLDNYQKSIDSAEDAVSNANDTVEKAKDAIEDAKNALQDVIDSTTDYNITAPISGQVIRKNKLAGDTISANSVLCIIYDLSALTFDMNVDELDVMTVKVGQEVNITADALEGIKISGVITNISLESTASGGVTQYPVTVRIDKAGDLLPGMNVTGEIIVDKVEGVITIPSDALMRGDVVYVADKSVTEATGDVPAGFKEVAVKTGLTDGDYIEIISGLTGNEEVYVKRNATEAAVFMPGQGFDRSNEGGFGGGSGNSGGPTRSNNMENNP